MATFAKASFGHASYASFRPSYPNTLYDAVLAFHQGPKKLCLDLGCGTGIASIPLAQRFERVIGTDPSAGMVSQAQKSAAAAAAAAAAAKPINERHHHHHQLNLSFHQSSAESSPFIKDASVDCITSAQAAHWFDYRRLWPELARITHPGSTLAFWGYKDHVFPSFPRASAIMQEYAYSSDPDKLGSYWPQPGRSYVQDKLRVIQPPAEEWEDVRRIEYEPGTSGRRSGQGTLFMERRVTVGECKAYVRTWSSYHGWKETHPGREARGNGGEGDVVDEIFDEIAERDGLFGDDGNEVDIEWGSALVMARRK